MLRIAIDKIDSLFDAIAEKQTLYIPVDREDGAAEYKKYESGMKMSNSLNTLRSAKDFFFPQTENLVEFKMEGKQIEVKDIREESEDFVIFGVRACDARSFSILDKVYLVDPVEWLAHVRLRPASVQLSELIRLLRRETFPAGMMEVIYTLRQIRKKEKHLSILSLLSLKTETLQALKMLRLKQREFSRFFRFQIFQQIRSAATSLMSILILKSGLSFQKAALDAEPVRSSARPVSAMI